MGDSRNFPILFWSCSLQNRNGLIPHQRSPKISRTSSDLVDWVVPSIVRGVPD
jgi:hypothetical protein